MRLQRLTLYQTKTTANDFAIDDPEVSEGIPVYANLEPVGGTETETADQQQGVSRFKITLRWGPGLAECDNYWWATREHPVTGKTERFNFTDVRNVGERNRELEIDAVRK